MWAVVDGVSLIPCGLAQEAHIVPQDGAGDHRGHGVTQEVLGVHLVEGRGG